MPTEISNRPIMNFQLRVPVLAAACVLLASCAHHGRMHPHGDYFAIEKQGYFFTGGEYRPAKDGNVMVGQMFVQYQIPRHSTSPYPVIMIHGGGQSGTNFLGTPDERPGWADY